MLTLDNIIAVSEQFSACGHWYVDLADDALVWSDQIYRIHNLSPQEPQPDVETAIAYYLEPEQSRATSRPSPRSRQRAGGSSWSGNASCTATRWTLRLA